MIYSRVLSDNYGAGINWSWQEERKVGGWNPIIDSHDKWTTCTRDFNEFRGEADGAILEIVGRMKSSFQRATPLWVAWNRTFKIVSRRNDPQVESETENRNQFIDLSDRNLFITRYITHHAPYIIIIIIISGTGSKKRSQDQFSAAYFSSGKALKVIKIFARGSFQDKRNNTVKLWKLNFY